MRRASIRRFCPEFRSIAVVLVFAGLALGCSDSTPLPELPAARAGAAAPEPLPGWRARAIDAVLEARVWQGARSGFVALVARDGRLIHASTAGYRDVEAERPMTIDTPFQIASMTKPVVAVAAMILVEEGRLGLDDPVARHLPGFADVQVATLDASGAVTGLRPPRSPILVRHVLSFTGGLGPGMDRGPLVDRWNEEGVYHGRGSLAERVERLTRLPLFFDPGTDWRYGASMDVVARLVEVVSGEPLDVFLERRIFGPLGMRSTAYYRDWPPEAPLAVMYTTDADGELVRAEQEVVPDDWTPGGFGLVSTAPDYMRFALMLWNEGEFAGARILKRETVDRMRRFEIESGVLEAGGIEGLGFGLGVSVVADSERTRMTTRNGDFWWSGAYGTHFWVSPSTGIVLVVMQQHQTARERRLEDPPIVPFVVQALALGAG